METLHCLSSHLIGTKTSFNVTMATNQIQGFGQNSYEM